MQKLTNKEKAIVVLFEIFKDHLNRFVCFLVADEKEMIFDLVISLLDNIMSDIQELRYKDYNRPKTKKEHEV